MGVIYEFKCSRCGYELEAWLGSGMLSGTITNANKHKYSKGKFGEDIRAFFDEHPDGILSSGGSYVFKCVECGELSCATEYAIFLPKDDKTLPPAPPHTIFLFPQCPNHRPYKNFVRHYEKCGGKLAPVHDEWSETPLECPRCHGTLWKEFAGVWD